MVKCFWLVLALLFSAGAFAQDLDTTFFVSAKGDTVGVIHKKGEVPLLPGELATTSQKNTPASVFAKFNYADSVAYYRELVDKDLASGKACEMYGTIGLAVGAVAIIAGVALIKKNPENDVHGVVIGSLGVVAFVTSSIFYIKGGHRLKRAGRNMKKRDRFKEFLSEVNLSVAPAILPLEKSLGGNLALSF